MSRELRDYLDAVSPSRTSRRGFGAFSAPPVGTPGLYDSEMWTMDVRWAPSRNYADSSGVAPPQMSMNALRPSSTGKAMWASSVRCIRVAEIGGGWISQPWAVTGAALCTNPAGVRQHPKCPWGVWRLPTCTSESISLAWQGQRYLWAQQKMREMLAAPPSRETAAQWVWSAYQLISLLHWSTNIRFGNPQARMFDYARQLETEGCIAPGFGGINTARADGQQVSRSGGGGPVLANWNRVAESDDSPVRPERGPGLNPPLVPLSRGDFSPWVEFSAPRGATSLPPALSAVLAQQAALAGSRRGWLRTLALLGPDPAAPMPTFVTWMAQTWGQSAVTVAMPSPGPGRAAYNDSIPGAAQILESTRRALEHYVQVPYLKWQTTILTTYQLEMQPFTARLPGDVQFAFSQSIADFAGRAQALQAASWNRGEAASYTMAAMSLIASLVSAPAAAVLGIMFQLLDMLVGFLGDQGLLASGYSVCPAFPFIRVPDPPCDALGPPVDAVGLPVIPPTAPPGPIMLTPQQRATLFELQRRGALSPSQQALIARPLVLVSPTPAPAAKSGLVPLGIGAALLALFFSRR